MSGTIALYHLGFYGIFPTHSSEIFIDSIPFFHPYLSAKWEKNYPFFACRQCPFHENLFAFTAKRTFFFISHSKFFRIKNETIKLSTKFSSFSFAISFCLLAFPQFFLFLPFFPLDDFFISLLFSGCLPTKLFF